MLQLFRKPSRAGGEKEGSARPAGRAPAAPSGGNNPAAPDLARQLAAMAEALNGVVTSHRSLMQALGQAPRESSTGDDAAPVDPAPAGFSPGAEPEAAGPLTGEGLRWLVEQALAGRGGAAGTSARERYAREHLADLPDAYRRQLPDAGGEAELAAAEREIRRAYRQDLRAALGRLADVGGDEAFGAGEAAGANGVSPAAVVDYSKLTPVQQITLGLRDARAAGHPLRPGRTPAGRPAPVPADGNGAGGESEGAD